MQKRSRGGPVPVDIVAPRRDTLAALLADLGPVIYAARTSPGVIKIGFTTNLASRVRVLGSPSVLLGWRSGTFAEEQAIHDSLDGHARHGREWYPDSDPDVLAVVNQMRGDLGLPSVAA